MAPRIVFAVRGVFQKPNMAAGGMFNIWQSNLAIFKVGSERPETKSFTREGLIPISPASCFWLIPFSSRESSISSAIVGFFIGKCSFSYAITISDMTVSSTAFLSFVGILSLTKGRSSSTLANANSYCSFVILFITNPPKLCVIFMTSVL